MVAAVKGWFDLQGADNDTVNADAEEVEEDDFLGAFPDRARASRPSRRSLSKGLLSTTKSNSRSARFSLLLWASGIFLAAVLLAISLKTAAVLRQVSAKEKETEDIRKALEADIAVDREALRKAAAVADENRQMEASLVERDRPAQAAKSAADGQPEESAGHSPPKWSRQVFKLKLAGSPFSSLRMKKTKGKRTVLPDVPVSESQRLPAAAEGSASGSRSASFSEEATATALPGPVPPPLDGSGRGGDSFQAIVAKLSQEAEMLRQREIVLQRRQEDAMAEFRAVVRSQSPQNWSQQQFMKITEEIASPGTHPETRELLQATRLGKKASAMLKNLRAELLDQGMRDFLSRKQAETQHQLEEAKKHLRDLQRTLGSDDES